MSRYRVPNFSLPGSQPDDVDLYQTIYTGPVPPSLENNPPKGTTNRRRPKSIPISMINMLIGPDQIPFGIPFRLLISQSPLIRRALAPHNRQNKRQTVLLLPREIPDIFAMAMFWLHNNDIPLLDTLIDGPDSYTQLVDLWCVAFRLELAPLKIRILATVEHIRAVTNALPSPACMNHTWKVTRKEEDSLLRALFIDWYSHIALDQVPDAVSLLNREILQDLIPRLVLLKSPTPESPSVESRSVESLSVESPSVESPSAESPSAERDEMQGLWHQLSLGWNEFDDEAEAQAQATWADDDASADLELYVID